MKIVIADKAGFCFGVKRALKVVNQLYRSGKKVQTFGPLIHNDSVLDSLSKKGVNYVSVLRQIDLEKILVIRTHGVSKRVENHLKKSKINYVDATCPLVKKTHQIIENLGVKNIPIILVGDKYHPEIVAAKSYARQVMVINSIAEANALPRNEN